MKSPEEIPLYTDREKEEMHLLQKGYSYKMIATVMGISEHTVAAYVKSLKAKSNTHNIGGVVAHGFLHPLSFII